MFGIKKVAEITGIPAITLRAWENRYDVIKPMRTDGGTRLYSQENIDDIKWVIEQREAKGISIKQAMTLLKNMKDNQIEPAELTRQETSPANTEQFIEEIFDALANYDTSLATHFINLAFSLNDYEKVFHDVFTPILHKVGIQWQEGKISVAQEHFISHFLQRRLFSFFQDITGDSSKPKALAICPPSELHNIGLILFSLFLKRRGIDVIFIGENTPKENILPLIQVNNVRLICFSVTIQDHVDHLKSFIKYIETYKIDVDYVIGGSATNALPEEYKRFVLNGDINQWEKWLINSKII
ncbi:MerR family transcriptional regulator [Aquibacillus rhizosphaerae]|uniref:MerR family transcriptional regulator n=1 Tax=Aquibacillus rhizosphaerae TaxID=3051431 RepID=A0ABT7L5P8_9BACI|nr:MerR family transcriptional regulator [Aquibacillus sp. LR5S19]MDL4841179.1 MerR family transcriptional regulator [Aquibacillus sp. LR5S19]